MRRAFVRKGLKLLIAAVCLLVAASFFHEQLAAILSLSPAAAGESVYFAFLSGGILGGIGIIFLVAGLVLSGRGEQGIRLGPTLLLLLAVVILFFFLLYRSFTAPGESPRLRPGETIVI